MADTPDVPGPVRTLTAQLAVLTPMRRGSLSERYVKCGKPGCACAERPAARHGPYYSLTRTVGGRTQSRFVPAAQTARVRQQIVAGQQFRRHVDAVWDACEEWADAQLDVPEAAAQNAAKKGGFTEAFTAEVVAEIEALVGPGTVDGLDFEAIETAARRRALAIAARAVEHRFNADQSDHCGPTLACGCGQPARYAGRRAKTFESALGALTLDRAYYHCAVCDAGFCPRDRALGLQDSSLSPAVTRMVGRVGAMVSFVEGSVLMQELAAVPVDPKQVERTAEALGREIAEDERRRVEPAPPPAPTMYLGLDGTGVPMRASELAGHAGKQPDGSAKTREVKLCTVWTAEKRDDEGIPVRDPGSVSYSAAIESAASRDTAAAPSAFAQRADREARRRGFDQAARRVVLGDGAPWIWNLADELFPGASQIVDLFHAKQHLSDVAKAIYGPGSALARRWAQQRHDELDAGQFDALLLALRVHAETHDEARKCLDYVTRNQSRMRYPQFRAQGLCVSSGVVEAGCKVAIGTRLKRAGMHWTVSGADAIIALRCCLLSGRFEDFWERRSAAAGVGAA